MALYKVHCRIEWPVTPKAAYLSSQFDRILSLNKANLAAVNAITAACLKAPSPMGVCRIDWAAQLTQTRMPEGFNLMSNQNQALSTPDNLVGGAAMRTIPACRADYLTTL